MLGWPGPPPASMTRLIAWAGRGPRDWSIELRVYNHVYNKHRLAFYRTPAGAEIDFVIETRSARLPRRRMLSGLEIKLAIVEPVSGADPCAPSTDRGH